METRKERKVKSIFATASAVVVGGALLAGSAAAQTVQQSDWNQPAVQPYGGQMVVQPYAARTTAPLQAAPRTLPPGPYLTDCKDARMLQDTLTAFCPRGDGSWQTTQLMQADRCIAGVENAAGDLVCGMRPQEGSGTPPENYGSSYAGTYGTTAAPGTAYGAYGSPTPLVTGSYPPGYAPVPNQTYAAPSYNAYGPYGYNPYAAYAPAPDQYVAPSAARTAQPYGY